MHFDILIFAIIAAFLIHRLNAVLGSRHGQERERPNPFAAREARPAVVPKPAVAPKTVTAFQPVSGAENYVDAEANKDGRVATGLAEIASADHFFEVNTFMQGARQAFEMIVKSYAAGDLQTLQELLSPKLYKDFAAGIAARQAAGQTMELTLHRIAAARITEAHLGGTMAYVTVDYDVEETTVTRDAAGSIVDGSPDRLISIRDIWTFTRDTRSSDPNWILIETRSAEK